MSGRRRERVILGEYDQSALYMYNNVTIKSIIVRN